MKILILLVLMSCKGSDKVCSFEVTSDFFQLDQSCAESVYSISVWDSRDKLLWHFKRDGSNVSKIVFENLPNDAYQIFPVKEHLSKNLITSELKVMLLFQKDINGTPSVVNKFYKSSAESPMDFKLVPEFKIDRSSIEKHENFFHSRSMKEKANFNP